MVVSEYQQLIFSLDKELYGFSLVYVKEVIGMMKINYVPNLPHFIKGIINLRDTIIPIIDLREKFGGNPKEYSDLDCIIIVETEILGKQRRTGIIVDEIEEVKELNPDWLEPAPTCNTEVSGNFIKNIAKIKDKVVMLLAADEIVADGI